MAAVGEFSSNAGGLVSPASDVTFEAVLGMFPGEADLPLTGKLIGPDGTVRATAVVVLDKPDPEADPTLSPITADGAWSLEVVDDAGTVLGSVTAVAGERVAPDEFRALFTWRAPGTPPA